MESASDMQGVPSGKNTRRWKPRKGQQDFIEWVKREPDRRFYTGRFPTGYGKTEIIVGAYAALRDQGRANRLLVVVPTTVQEEQYAHDLERKARGMGIVLSGVVSAEGTVRTIRYHRRNEAEVFITTVQRLRVAANGGINWAAELINTGMWIGAADEYHHYGDKNTWGKTLNALPFKQWLAVSATPARKIGETVFGEPHMVVTYEEAFQEHAVKDVRVCLRDYTFTIENAQQQMNTYRTSDLVDEAKRAGLDFDSYEMRCNLRYFSKYCSPILNEAVNELRDLHLDAPTSKRPQMLVYAFSCRHAHALCEIIKVIAPDFGVDWVGTGPNFSREDNDQVLARFMDKKNENNDVTVAHTLDILVQVNIASEGFDSVPVCVIVDLSMIGFGPQKLQQWGRGTRIYGERALHIYVPTDSQMARLVDSLRDQPNQPRCVFDCPIETEIPDEKPPRQTIDIVRPLPDWTLIDAQMIGGHDYEPTREDAIMVAPLLEQHLGRRFDPKHNDADADQILGWLRDAHRNSTDRMSETNRREHWQEVVRKTVGHVASDRVKATHKGDFEKSAIGDTIKRIHSQWYINHRGHDAMTSDDFKAKYQWLRDLQQEIIAGRIPKWL